MKEKGRENERARKVKSKRGKYRRKEIRDVVGKGASVDGMWLWGYY